MSMRKIENMSEMEQIYRERMVADFTADERPPLSFFLQMMAQASSGMYVFEKDGQDAAYAVFREQNEYILLNYMAVYQGQRSKGVGSEFLKELAKFFENKKSILLEVEHTAYATDPANAQLRKKRIAFYERSGYVCLNHFDFLLFGVHYHIMIKALREDKSSEPLYIYEVLRGMYNNENIQLCPSAL